LVSASDTRARVLVGACLVAALLLVACERGPFSQPLVLGGRTYPAAQLNRGYYVYRKGCRACHGERGDGHGVSAPGLWPPPRDLTQGVYKFGRVPTPGLPPDAELARILRHGLDGTAMLAWAIPDEDLAALLGYVKSLAPRWRTESVGEPVVAGKDPYTGASPERLREVITRGEVLYHTKTMCSTCHPAYVTRARLYEITKAAGAPVTAYTPQMYVSRVKDTEFCWRWHPLAPGASLDDRTCDEPVRTVPPDFLHDPLRAIRRDAETSDLFATLGAGIPGAGMPPWKGALTDDELWTLAHYVASLLELRGTDRGEQLRASLRSNENIEWVPPAD
jgi:mono/diheme cytochrome c family protein